MDRLRKREGPDTGEVDSKRQGQGFKAQLIAEWGLGVSGGGEPPPYGCCSSLACFCAPNHVALDKQGFVYVSEEGRNRMKKLSPSGEVVAHWGDGTTQFYDVPCGQVGRPSAMDVDPDGNVYVAEDSARCISRFDSNGALLGSWVFPEYDKLRGHMPAINDLVADRFGRVIILTSWFFHEHGLLVFDGTGKKLGNWKDVYLPEEVGPAEQANCEVGHIFGDVDGYLYVVALYFDPPELADVWVFVVDPDGNKVDEQRIHKFFTSPCDDSPGFSLSAAGAIDGLQSGGVTAFYSGSCFYIQALGPGLLPVGRFGEFMPHWEGGTPSDEPGLIGYVSSIVGANGRIYVADPALGKVFVFAYDYPAGL